MANNKEERKIFISHASADKQIAQDFIDLLLNGALGVGIDEIFASSIEGAKIKSGDDWRDAIKENLTTAKITFIIITPYYKESEVCLNEMGAAWVLSGKTIPLLVDPINYKTVGIIQEPNQVEKLMEEGGLDRIRDIVQEELEIHPAKIKSDRWTQKKKEFIAKLKKHVAANPFPVAIERSVFVSLLAEVHDLNGAMEYMIREKMELEELIAELKAAKDKEAVKNVLKKREKTNEVEEFKELVNAAKTALKKYGYVIQKIIFKEFSRNEVIKIDVEANRRVLDEAVARKIINEELELNHDNPKVEKVFTALIALKKFMAGQNMTVAVDEYFEEEYHCAVEIDNLDFWEEVFDLEMYF